MSKKRWLSVFVISSLVVTFSLVGGSVSLAQEEKIKDPFTELELLNPEEYLKYRGKKYVEVELSPAMEVERINTPMTPNWKPKSPPWTIGWSDITIHNPWRMTVTWEGKYEVSKYPDLIKNFIQVEAGGDINKQISDIENLIARGVDALIICPGSPGALVPVIEKAYDKGIPVIVFHGRVNTEKFTSGIQPDEYGMGWLFGTWLGERLKGKGKIIGFKALPGYKPAIDRWQGAFDAISRYPGIKLLGAEFAHWSPIKARQAATDLLAAHPQFDGVLSVDPWATAAVIELMAAQGMSFVPMTGFEENSSFKLWLKYDIEGIGANEPSWLGAEAVKVAMKVLQGEPVFKRYLTRVPIVTKEDAKRLYRADMPDSYYPGSHLPEEILEKIYK